MSLDMTSAYGLNGKVALFTGGGSGPGLAIAKCQVTSGWHVISAGSREDA